jgi:hypothetical protein
LDLENRIINIEILAEVAEALKDIKDDMVFVGGAVVREPMTFPIHRDALVSRTN